MTSEYDTASSAPAQGLVDPIITNARIANWHAEIERKLAARRALRPARSDAARKGWGTRNDR